MTFKIDEMDLTPPPVDDEYRFRTWLIENFSRVYQTLINGFTGDIAVGNYTHTFEFGVLLTRELTEVFSDDFSEDFL